MKKRQKEILNYIFNNQNIDFDYILKKFNISKRTLYYDIEDINYEIKKHGKLEKLDNLLIYHGSDEIKNEFNLNKKIVEDIEYRRNKIIDKIFNDDVENLDLLSEELIISKNTIINDLENIKNKLKKFKIVLIYDSRYKVLGDENLIREFYLKHLMLDEDLLKYSDNRILKINKEANLKLTDFSISYLSKYLYFCEKRIKKGHILKELNFNALEVKNIYYYNIVSNIIDFENDLENVYLVAYIASLTNTRNKEIKTEIKDYIEKLIFNFEKFSAIHINDKENFVKQISNHFLSSYYRIKFDFPIVNPLLDDIKNEYSYLFEVVKDSINQIDNDVFKNLREDEIGFITVYFGSNINYFLNENIKVIIVCPNGLMISKLIEMQIINYFPTVEIVDSISSRDIKKINKSYDYIISTIDLNDYNNVILVNPIFSNQNIAELSEKLIKFNYFISENAIYKLIEIIKQNAKVYDEDKLSKEIFKFFIKKKELKERRDPLLSELLNENRVTKIKEVNDWKVAIAEASKPLIDDKSIDESYVELMINSVLEYGPYIVLEDGFAMPHANGGKGVNKLSVSIMALENPVDLLGKSVRVFLVLATTDSKTHLRALSALSKILEDEENIKILETGDYEKIINLIKKKEKE
ncbi:PTS sugar transporter subunit IIA [Helcococcus ovis]|uniref:BglG family transcription antiterminator n=1 Tax=Helcococcus ovis TaxID=72026 RepID=UPI0039175E85